MKRKLLEKMEMPSAKKEESLELEMALEPESEMEEGEELSLDDSEMDVPETEGSEPSPLADISDDELKEEFRKRGLSLEEELSEDESDPENYI